MYEAKKSINPDLNNERQKSDINLDEMKSFLGEILYGSKETHKQMNEIRKDLVTKIKPIFYENFYNLTRSEKYELMYKKSIEITEYMRVNNIDPKYFMRIPVVGVVIGPEKYLFQLHLAAFKVSIELWGNEAQNRYWSQLMDKNFVIGTYIQTELGHGTFVRGLETTATYDKTTKEFIIHSPTLTSIKFWPGSGGITCNYGIVMAKLIIDNKDYGIQAFVVPLRSLDDHRLLKGVETGDIGTKIGFESLDNGYIKFSNHRIPLFNMLMKHASVDESGNFKKIGNELVMYASMLLLRASLCLFGDLNLSLSTTIAIRYSCVRRQTADMDGVEPQIIEYQTQQYRLFPGLAATYSHFFAANSLMNILNSFREASDNFRNINSSDLGKLHAVSAGLKAQTFNNALRFAQINRLCCGGHGYSASSGLSQIVQEADAGCTYEGDNIVLLLQTARYLLKCAQKGVSPHLKSPTESMNTKKYFDSYLDVYVRLYDGLISELSDKMFNSISNGTSEYDAWNQNTVYLVNMSKVYISIFVLKCNLEAIANNHVESNQNALADLCELFILYELIEDYSSNLLRLKIIDSDKLNKYWERVYELLPKIRKNAVALVDSFDYYDSNLCSSLGAYDGNAYERLFEFAKNSKLNQKQVHDAYEKYMKPYVAKIKSKL